MDDRVPIYRVKELEDASKFTELQNFFVSSFSKLPEFYVRCPGRVNIIGEHIDYSGFSVLPMAIEKDVLVAVGISDNETLHIVNFDSEYEPYQSQNDVFINKEHLHWYDYILCGYKGIKEKYELKNRHLNIAVKGIIPISSGLSSSSALVCSGALATAFSNGLQLNRIEMADLCASSERYIGTQGGGMDQAIIFLGEEGFAKKIEFNPIRTTNVHLPEDLHFIVAHSGVTMNKAATSHFNKRVAECLLAAKVLAQLNDLDWKMVNKLSDVPFHLKKTVSEMVDCVKQSLNDKEYTKHEICQLLKLNDSGLQDILKDMKSSNSLDFETFLLGKRARHVYSEACNVDAFITSCQIKDLENIGQLMKNSHTSLRESYDCSHAKLDALVDAAEKGGAVGARLTGAGWGGCIIAAVTTENKEELLNVMRRYAIEHGLKSESVFLTKPSGGAAIYT